jgi:hypothetical protein
MKRISAAFAVAVATVAMSGAGARELIQNGGFETGNFTGWTVSGIPNNMTVNGVNPQTGYYATAVAPPTRGILSQMVSTVPGEQYSFSFWLASNTTTLPAIAGFGSQDLEPFGNWPSSYTQYQFTVTATSDSTEIRFATDAPGFFYLDNVSLVPIPEPSTIVALTALGAMAGVGIWRRARRRKTTDDLGDEPYLEDD